MWLICGQMGSCESDHMIFLDVFFTAVIIKKNINHTKRLLSSFHNSILPPPGSSDP